MKVHDLEPHTTSYKRTITRSFVFWLILTFVAILIDQVLKWIIFKHVAPTILISNIISIVHFSNPHFALSIPLPQFLQFIIYGPVLTIAVIYTYTLWPTFRHAQKIAWLLILAGGLSNVIERIALGYVRDFLYLYSGLIINMADIYIVTGIAVLVIYEYKKLRDDKTKTSTQSMKV